MLGSLRVRLPLVFLAGIVLAGVITTLISIRLFRDFSHEQALTKLKREGQGIALLYARAVNESYGNTNKKGKPNDRKPPTFAAKSLQLATGDKIYFVGPGLFPEQGFTGLQRLPWSTIDWISGKSLTFEFTPPDATRTYLAVANPILTDPGKQTIGAVVVATPKTNVNSIVSPLIQRLAVARPLRPLVAAVLPRYLPRRLLRPRPELTHPPDPGPPR